jgi:hyperosmotically inducible protein
VLDAETGFVEYARPSFKERRQIMKMHDLASFCSAVVVGATLVVAPLTVSAKTTEKTPFNDAWLTAKTKISLAADGRVKGRQIDVRARKGIVMLRGKVDSDAAKFTAEDITKGLEGVKHVKNDLEVVPPAAHEAVEENDDAITTHVKEHLAKDVHLKKSGIAVQTNAGVVSLTGEVRSLSTSASASWMAWSVPGVKSVKNDLTVKEKR